MMATFLTVALDSFIKVVLEKNFMWLHVLALHNKHTRARARRARLVSTYARFNAYMGILRSTAQLLV